MATFTGRVFERVNEGGIGRVVPNARITFTDAHTNCSTTVQSKASGTYQVDLSPSQYLVKAEHPDFATFGSDPWFVILNHKLTTADIFLRRSPQIVPQISRFRGQVLQHMANGQRGTAIDNATVTFIHRSTAEARTVRTDRKGCYEISLSTGQYFVTAVHPQFEVFSSEPGVFVLGSQPTRANIFLKPLALAVAA